MNKTLRFVFLLFVILLLAFGGHILILYLKGIALFDHRIVLTYTVNYILALLILFLVEKNMKEESAKAGFVFLGGSLVKFLVFFLVFQPSYKEDGVMQNIEFITFFVPYALCLTLEVFYLTKQLNKQ